MTTIVNGRLLGQGSNAQIMAGNAAFSFNGYNLNNGTTIRLKSCNIDDLGTIDLETFKYGMQDGGGVLGRYYRTKTITIELSIQEETEQKLYDLMDEIKYRTDEVEGPLRMKYGDTVREWTASRTVLKFNKAYYNINRLGDVQITFKATKPHSHAMKSTKINITSQEDLYKNSISYLGRAKSYLTIALSIGTSGTDTLYYTLNGYTLEIPSRSYSAGDTVILDGVTKKVTINGSEVEYNGSFRPLDYGDNPIEISYNGTYTATLSYYNNYL